MKYRLPEKRKVHKLTINGGGVDRIVGHDFTLHQDVLFSINREIGESKPPNLAEAVTIALSFDNHVCLDDILYTLFERRTVGKGVVPFSMKIVDFGGNTFEVDSNSSSISPYAYCRNSHSRTYHIEGGLRPRVSRKKYVPHLSIKTAFVRNGKTYRPPCAARRNLMRRIYDYLVKLGLLVPLEEVQAGQRRIKEQQRKGFEAERRAEHAAFERNMARLRSNYKRFWNE